ncbi:MAG: hypothetical protein GX359_02490 [Clostridiales bacterium]|nr:hypothetical protein [Clostridiales bacterium]
MWKIRMWKRERETLRFSGRSHSKRGIWSAVIGIGIVIGFFTLSILSSNSHGNGGIFLGIIGILLFCFAIYGFRLSYKAFKEKDIFYHFPIIGCGLNGIMIIVLMILYILGLGG